MSCYISSNNNRFYVGTESSYGVAPAIQGRNRIPAVKLKAKQEKERVVRKDKTGTRTFAGVPPGVRHRTSVGLTTYMTSWADQTQEPCQGPLFSAALGADVQMWSGGAVSSASGLRLTFAAAHSLSVGQAVAIGGELRFVTAVVDAVSVQLNAPFTRTVVAGSTAGPTATYRVASCLKSAAIFDYWDPATAVQRVLTGVAIDKTRIKVNGDFHEFEFAGMAADVLDTSSFSAGQAGLQQFPPEPQTANFDYSIIPGHLGQAWIGSVPNQFLTLTSAEIHLDNAVNLRHREFGSDLPLGVVAGVRDVFADFTVFAEDDTATTALYQAARQKSPVDFMIQLGQQPKQLFGVHMASVMPQVPEFDDSDTRLQWSFRNNRAQGGINDEITIAFA